MFDYCWIYFVFKVKYKDFYNVYLNFILYFVIYYKNQNLNFISKNCFFYKKNFVYLFNFYLIIYLLKLGYFREFMFQKFNFLSFYYRMQ